VVDRGAELDAEDPVNSALEVEPQPQAPVGQQRARDPRLFGHEIREAQEREQRHQCGDRTDPVSQAAHESSPFFFVTLSTRARATLTRTRSPLTEAISRVNTSSVTPVTLP